MFFFTQMDQTQTPEGSRIISKLFPQDRNINLGWKALCTLLCTIALILECINVTLNERCNHQNNQTTVSLLKTIPKLLPVHSETNISNDVCAERKEFPLRASNKRVKVCTYQTTQHTSGGAVTADTSCCATCVEPSRPQQWGPDLPLFFCHADPLDGWRCWSEKQVMSRPIQVRQL